MKDGGIYQNKRKNEEMKKVKRGGQKFRSNTQFTRTFFLFVYDVLKQYIKARLILYSGIVLFHSNTSHCERQLCFLVGFLSFRLYFFFFFG